MIQPGSWQVCPHPFEQQIFPPVQHVAPVHLPVGSHSSTHVPTVRYCIGGQVPLTGAAGVTTELGTEIDTATV